MRIKSIKPYLHASSTHGGYDGVTVKFIYFKDGVKHICETNVESNYNDAPSRKRMPDVSLPEIQDIILTRING